MCMRENFLKLIGVLIKRQVSDERNSSPKSFIYTNQSLTLLNQNHQTLPEIIQGVSFLNVHPFFFIGYIPVVLFWENGCTDPTILY